MKYYIFNLETTKIELHFEKSEYNALSEAQKAELKSAFLWSNYGKCWVSRAKEPNLWRAKEVARKLGFTEEQREGERISFAEQQDRRAERAEARAERYEGYASNAEKRAQALQKPINDMHGDIAFFTQPNINSSSGRAFANRRERMFNQYRKGFDEYRKSDYFAHRAAIARDTAEQGKFEDVAYLDRRIKEVRTEIKKREKNVIHYEDQLYRIENGETFTRYNGEPITADEVKSWLDRELELIEVAMDKEGYLLNCLDECGGIRFSPENIKVGYIVEIKRHDQVEIVSKGSVNFTYKILTGGAAGMVLTAAYAEIVKIVKAENAKSEIVNPFAVGDILTLNRPADNSVYRAFQVLKTTEKSIQIQEVEVVDGMPQSGKFRSGSKSERKGIVKSKFSDYVGAYYDDWQMRKYIA